MTTAAIIKSKIELDVSEFVEGAEKIEKEVAEIKREAADFADAAAIVGDKFDDTGASIDKWIDALNELSPETQKFRGEWEGILEQFRTGEVDMQTTLERLKDLKERMSEGEEGTLDFSKSLKQMAKGLIGISGVFMLGRAVMGFGKDALDAAAATGKLSKNFDANAKASDRLKLAIGVQLGRALKDTTGFLAEFKNELAENIEKGNEMAEMFELLGYTAGDIANYYGQIRTGVTDSAEAYVDLIAQVEALGIAEESEMEIAMRAAKVASERGTYLNALGESMGIVVGEAQAAADAFEGVEVGITGMIEAALELVEWERAGGAEFADKFKAFWEKVVSEGITDEKVIDAALQMFEAASLGLEQEVGAIDWYPAAKRYQKQFGGTIWEANEEIVLNWAAMQVYLNEVDFETAAQKIVDQLGIPIKEARKELFAIGTKMRALDGLVSTVDLVVTTWDVQGTGTPPTGGAYQARKHKSNKQLGGRFFAGETMLIGEGTVGGELVTAGVGGEVITNAAIDNSEIVERLESLENTMVNMGQDIVTGIELAVS